MNLPRAAAAAAVVVTAVVAMRTLAHSQPAETLQDLMVKAVNEASSEVWNTPDSFYNDQGEPTGKATNAEWLKLKAAGQRLADAAQQAALPNRPIAPLGKFLFGEGQPGNRPPDEIARLIAADPAAFAARAQALRDAGLAAAAAAERHDVAGYVAAGEKAQDACTSCHAAYWYSESAGN